MCWKSFSTKRPQAKIAENDIEVIKFLVRDGDDNLYSPYKQSLYEIDCEKGIEEELAPIHRQDCYWAIDNGLHTYSVDCKIEITWSDIHIFSRDGKTHLDYWAGDYTLDEADEFGDVVVAICTIPKGAKYFMNKDGEVVSDRLIPEKVVAYLWDMFTLSRIKKTTFKREFHLD